MQTRSLFLLAAISLSSLTARADTILNFNFCPAGTPSSPCITNPTGWTTVTNENNTPPAFGDNVSQNLDPNGFGYYRGTADTPDITVQFDSRSLSGWYNWGGTEAGLSFASDTGNGFVTLVAAPGFAVTLLGFDYNVAGSEGYTLQVYDGGPTSTTILDDYSGSTTGNSAEHFSPDVTSNEITIFFNNWNTGLQNIDFSESAVSSTPEPATLSLFGLGVMGLVFRRRLLR